MGQVKWKEKKMMSAGAQEFLRGFACAMACLARDHDRPSMAKDIATSNGLSLRDFRLAEVDEFDLKEVRKAFAS